MAFSIPATIDWLKHSSLQLPKFILGRQPEYFINIYRKADINVSPTRDQNDELVCCRICGYAMAQLKLTNDWSLETCSAAGLTPVLGNKNFNQWQSSTLNTIEINK